MHRLLVAGHRSGMPFEDRALEKLHAASRGIPRLINILCHKALMVCFGQGVRTVSLEAILMAIRDTEDAQLSMRRAHWWQRFVAAGAAAAVLVTISSAMMLNMV